MSSYTILKIMDNTLKDEVVKILTKKGILSEFNKKIGDKTFHLKVSIENIETNKEVFRVLIKYDSIITFETREEGPQNVIITNDAELIIIKNEEYILVNLGFLTSKELKKTLEKVFEERNIKQTDSDILSFVSLRLKPEELDKIFTPRELKGAYISDISGHPYIRQARISGESIDHSEEFTDFISLGGELQYARMKLSIMNREIKLNLYRKGCFSLSNKLSSDELKEYPIILMNKIKQLIES